MLRKDSRRLKSAPQMCKGEDKETSGRGGQPMAQGDRHQGLSPRSLFCDFGESHGTPLAWFHNHNRESSILPGWWQRGRGKFFCCLVHMSGSFCDPMRTHKHQASLSMGFPNKNTGMDLPFPPLRIL